MGSIAKRLRDNWVFGNLQWVSSDLHQLFNWLKSNDPQGASQSGKSRIGPQHALLLILPLNNSPAYSPKQLHPILPPRTTFPGEPNNSRAHENPTAFVPLEQGLVYQIMRFISICPAFDWVVKLILSNLSH